MLLLSGCHHSNEPEDPTTETGKETEVLPELEVESYGDLVLSTYNEDWRVKVFRSGVLASDSYYVPYPFHLPTREEANVLKNVTYETEGERYLTEDGYTFGMPSASVSKAGTKKTYSVLGVYRKETVIYIQF